ncbi:MAG TPA: glycosyltransferase family 39 protein, partial [Chloroflexota bacterium]|nr:glycosyltransferase family 39 protein [Chloroflexota bacterium]
MAKIARRLIKAPNYLALLAGLILLGFGLRVLRLDYQALWLDELYSLYIANFPLHDLGHQMATDPVFISDVPLYYALLAVWVRLAGSGEFAARYVSLICGVLSLPLLYQLLRLRLARTPAVLGAGLLAISAFHVYYSQEARMHMLAFLLCLASAYTLLQAVRLGATARWIAYAILAAAALYTF